jgi:selenocysteine lyase/cysteine desulfurase
MVTLPLDLARIRAEFPALAGDWVFLDNAGGSQVLRRVADRIADYLLTTSVQLGASYAVSRDAGERVLAARRTIARLINAEYDEEVVVGSSTTALMFMLAQAIAPGIRPGDEIVATQITKRTSGRGLDCSSTAPSSSSGRSIGTPSNWI